MVTDKIKELPVLARNRIVERLNDLGVEYIPDVYFDGGYKQLTGGQQSEQPYRNAISQSGGRNVPDIDIDINVKWTGLGNTIKIEVTVTNNEPEDYNGILRVYITEIESDWTDAHNNEYRYVVLDIPIDDSLSIKHDNYIKNQQDPLGGSYTFTKWWSGDITKNNCMILAAVFDKDSGYTVQTATSTPSSIGLYEFSSKSAFNNIFTTLFEKLVNSFPILKTLL
jgi:hypothetical protein